MSGACAEMKHVCMSVRWVVGWACVSVLTQSTAVTHGFWSRVVTIYTCATCL